MAAIGSGINGMSRRQKHGSIRRSVKMAKSAAKS